MKFVKKQKGVVLLTCLMFLLMLLVILRFTIGSARVEEMKAGADYDEMSARSVAYMVLRDAEMDIKRINHRGESLQDTSLNINNPSDQAMIMKKANEYWGGTIARGGVYDGDNRLDTETKPLYATINSWNNNTCSNQVVCFGSQTGSKARYIKPNGDIEEVSGQRVGKYIIERFMGDGAVLGLGSKDAKNVILRVTAVGFSKPQATINANTSHAIVQAVYILSP